MRLVLRRLRRPPHPPKIFITTGEPQGLRAGGVRIDIGAMDTDFLVIGGGIAGTAAGAQLAALGRVVLLEAESALAYHASGRSAALFEVNYGHPVTVALNEASAEAHRNTDGGWLSPRGLMLVAGPGQEAGFAEEAAQMKLEEISIEAALGHVPILNPNHLQRAAYHDGAWDLDTDRMVQVYARAIRENGAVLTGETVSEIVRIAGGGWQVTTSKASYRARVVLNAAGAWADKIAAMAGVAPLGLTPLRRSMARLPAPGGHDVRTWPMIIGRGESWYAKPDAGAWLISPAEEDPVDEPHDAYSDDMTLAEGIARYQPFVTEEVTRLSTSWAGLRTFAPDRCLVIGPDAEVTDFLWFAGQGGYGFQTAPAASALLAERAAGRTPSLPREIVAALDPARFGQGGKSTA